MRHDDGLGGDRERVVERLVGNMREVHQHPQSVHLMHYFFAKIRQPLCAGTSVDESAQLLLRECVSVIDRIPNW